MQLQLNVNDVKANILLKFLDIFKEDNIIQDYKVLTTRDTTHYNEYEKSLLEDISNLSLELKDDDIKTGKFINISE